MKFETVLCNTYCIHTWYISLIFKYFRELLYENPRKKKIERVYFLTHRFISIKNKNHTLHRKKKFGVLENEIQLSNFASKHEHVSFSFFGLEGSINGERTRCTGRDAIRADTRVISRNGETGRFTVTF